MSTTAMWLLLAVVIVVILFVHQMHQVGIASLEVIRQRIAISHNSIRCPAMQNVMHTCTIAAHQIFGMLQYRQRHSMRGIISIA